MKVIFADTEAIYHEEKRIWESEHEIFMDTLNSRLLRERKSMEEKDYSVAFAVKVAKKQMSSLEFVEEE